ncbi:unnamed protein product [Acanthoscelides obtectus]|uniref:Uncharacterized protein n=1 Tax=Acanthoscelides obtectus TaxID=200917 RepID=A0A9P0PLL0_ACAOB|nr:unnamed protein product [Acanthoscelides obtectus]CAK1633035.1 hypothetical protein AOBTE_LOCUS7891 [Acanthoscelides obtectus]
MTIVFRSIFHEDEYTSACARTNFRSTSKTAFLNALTISSGDWNL